MMFLVWVFVCLCVMCMFVCCSNNFTMHHSTSVNISTRVVLLCVSLIVWWQTDDSLAVWIVSIIVGAVVVSIVVSVVSIIAIICIVIIIFVRWIVVAAVWGICTWIWIWIIAVVTAWIAITVGSLIISISTAGAINDARCRIKSIAAQLIVVIIATWNFNKIQCENGIWIYNNNNKSPTKIMVFNFSWLIDFVSFSRIMLQNLILCK